MIKIPDATSPEADAVRRARMARHDGLPEGLRHLALEYDDSQVIKAANWLGTTDPARVKAELIKMFGPPIVPKAGRGYKRRR